ncbi:MAG: tetratricopeptide repeat protein [Candidatus Krumholzibacteria bacterium]|nr:tetratricopeptide repeat protein [Candidatus Krumholzibacteria bacterium]
MKYSDKYNVWTKPGTIRARSTVAWAKPAGAWARPAILLILVCALALAASCAGQKGGGMQISVGDSITHRIKVGESWESIAMEYYGDSGRASDVARYNGMDPAIAPEPGTGIRVLLTTEDRRKLDRLVEAATFYNTGLELASQEKYSEAASNFEKAIEKDRGFTDAIYNLGVTWQKLGMHRKAVDLLSAPDMKEITTPEYLYALGVSYFHLRNYNKAKDAFEAVRKIDPLHLKSLFSLAVIYEKKGRLDDAATMLREYIKAAPDGAWRDQARAKLENLKE